MLAQREIAAFGGVEPGPTAESGTWERDPKVFWLCEFNQAVTACSVVSFVEVLAVLEAQANGDFTHSANCSGASSFASVDFEKRQALQERLIEQVALIAQPLPNFVDGDVVGVRLGLKGASRGRTNMRGFQRGLSKEAVGPSNSARLRWAGASLTQR